jgi:hypothetical protein
MWSVNSLRYVEEKWKEKQESLRTQQNKDNSENNRQALKTVLSGKFYQPLAWYSCRPALKKSLLNFFAAPSLWENTGAGSGCCLRFLTSVEVCLLFSAVRLPVLLCWRSQRRFFLNDSVSSVESMLRRVVRGESASCWLGMVFEVVMMMGFERDGSWMGAWSCMLGTGEPATDGPLGVVLRDRLNAGTERDASLAIAFARSGSCMSVVSIERLEVRLACESTRWNIVSRSFTEEGPLASSESSQSDESSSSSMALSEISSSSSSDSKTGLWRDAALPMATSSLNEVCFLLSRCFRLSDSELLYMWLSSELSSSPDDVPIVNMAGFFFGCDGWYLGDVFKIGVGCAARFVCERYEDVAPPALKPRTMLCVLISVDELSCEPDLSCDMCELWVLRVEDEAIGKAAVGVMAIGAAGSVGAGALGAGALLVSGWSNVNLEKSWEIEVEGSTAGTTTGSGLYEDAGMANSTRSRCWLSLMEMTIFSRSTGVMCFSRATFLLSVERWRVSSGRADGAQEASSRSSDTAESRLDDNSGTGMSVVAACGL